MPLGFLLAPNVFLASLIQVCDIARAATAADRGKGDHQSCGCRRGSSFLYCSATDNRMSFPPFHRTMPSDSMFQSER